MAGERRGYIVLDCTLGSRCQLSLMLTSPIERVRKIIGPDEKYVDALDIQYLG